MTGQVETVLSRGKLVIENGSTRARRVTGSTCAADSATTCTEEAAGWSGSRTGSAARTWRGSRGGSGRCSTRRRASRPGRWPWRRSRRSTTPSRSRRRPRPPGGTSSLSQRTRDPLPVPGAGRRAPPRGRVAAHGRARQGAVRRDGRGLPRAGEHRVRVRPRAPAQGRALRAGRARGRRLLAAPAARRGRRDHPVQLPGDGAAVDVPQRDRVREHLHPQAVENATPR